MLKISGEWKMWTIDIQGKEEMYKERMGLKGIVRQEAKNCDFTIQQKQKKKTWHSLNDQSRELLFFFYLAVMKTTVEWKALH